LVNGVHQLPNPAGTRVQQPDGFARASEVSVALDPLVVVGARADQIVKGVAAPLTVLLDVVRSERTKASARVWDTGRDLAAVAVAFEHCRTNLRSLPLLRLPFE